MTMTVEYKSSGGSLKVIIRKVGVSA